MQNSPSKPSANLRMVKEEFSMTAEQKKLILKMRTDFCGYTQISEATGLSVSSVKSYCYRHGLNTEALKASGGFCRLCGKPITKPSRTRPRKFCSDACKSAWWNRHRFDHAGSSAIVQFSCRVCGKQFRDYGSANRKYCSQVCYQKRGGVDG